jgi:ASCH domain.
MRVITIIQPWATLIALGEKKFETRSRQTHIRGELAIHAGKKIDREACEREPIKSILAKHGYTVDNLPVGAIIATSYLRDCHSVYMDDIGDAILLAESGDPLCWISKDSNEFHFGHYATNRYAWKLKNVKQLMNPVPAKGQQGFWHYDLKENSDYDKEVYI